MRRTLVVEGPGDAAFFTELIKAHDLSDFGIFCERDGTFGATAFEAALRSIETGSKYVDTELVVIVADCDESPQAEFAKVVGQIKNSGSYPIPKRPREIAVEPEKKSVSVLMLPWDNEVGSIETVCYSLASKERPDVAQCVNAFVKCVAATDWSPQHRAKLQLRSILGASCPKDPNTPLRHAWSGVPGQRPAKLIPLNSKNKMITRIAKYLRDLP
jgi:hypothetical protein